MRKVTILLSILISACSDEEKTYLYEYTVLNKSGFTVKMTCNDCEEVILDNNESKLFKSDYTYIDDYTLTSIDITTKVIDFDFGTGSADFDLVSYNYKVEYRVTGTATLFDAIIEHSNGEDGLWWDETIPWSVKFKTFNSTWTYISAQNGNNDNGCIKVEIYWRDKLFKSNQKCGPYEIATASGGIY